MQLFRLRSPGARRREQSVPDHAVLKNHAASSHLQLPQHFQPATFNTFNPLNSFNSLTLQPSNLQPFNPSSPSTPCNPSTLQPFHHSNIQPFNPSTLQLCNTSILQSFQRFNFSTHLIQHPQPFLLIDFACINLHHLFRQSAHKCFEQESFFLSANLSVRRL